MEDMRTYIKYTQQGRYYLTSAGRALTNSWIYEYNTGRGPAEYWTFDTADEWTDWLIGMGLTRDLDRPQVLELVQICVGLIARRA